MLLTPLQRDLCDAAQRLLVDGYGGGPAQLTKCALPLRHPACESQRRRQWRAWRWQRRRGADHEAL